jgi:cobalamin synthase
MRSGNLKEYMAVSVFFGCCIVAIPIVALIDWNPGWLLLYPIIAIPLGLFQLVAGVHLLLKFSSYGEAFKQKISNYWVLNLIYLVVVILITQFPVSYELHLFWWVIAPWGIALYQFMMVYGCWKDRRAGIVKAQKNFQINFNKS